MNLFPQIERAIGVLTSSIGRAVCVRFRAWVLVCRCSVRLGGGGAAAGRRCCVRLGAWVLVVPLCALTGLGAGAAGGRCCALGGLGCRLPRLCALGSSGAVPLEVAAAMKRERRSRDSLTAMIPMLSGAYAGVVVYHHHHFITTHKADHTAPSTLCVS